MADEPLTLCRTSETVPWTAEEDELVRTLSAQEVVRRTGRSLQAVYGRGAGYMCRMDEGEFEDNAG
jgi:hypothetical protein